MIAINIRMEYEFRLWPGRVFLFDGIEMLKLLCTVSPPNRIIVGVTFAFFQGNGYTWSTIINTKLQFEDYCLRTSD